MTVLDHVDLGDLLRAADSNHYLRDFIGRHYIRGKYRLNEKVFQITGKGAEYMLTINTEPHPTTITRFDSILSIFRQFGSDISHLHLDRLTLNATDLQLVCLAEYIQRYSRHALKTLRLEQKSNMVLAHWNQSFDRIQSVELAVQRQPLLELPALFPNVRELNMRADADFSFQSLHFPKLTHLKYTDRKVQSDKVILMELLARNHQIRSLDINRFVDMPTISYVSVNFPHLEYFHYKGLMYDVIHWRDDAFIRFPSVKHFSLDLIRDDNANQTLPFVFEQLETLDILYRGLSPIIVDFVANNQHLRRLSLVASGALEVNLLQLLDPLAELEELDFQWTPDVTINCLVELLSRPSKLQRLKVFLENTDYTERLLQAAPKNWSVEETILDYCSILLEFQRIK